MTKYLNVTITHGYMIPIDGLTESEILLIKQKINSNDVAINEPIAISDNEDMIVFGDNFITNYETIIYEES